jgi:hypothetical protein
MQRVQDEQENIIIPSVSLLQKYLVISNLKEIIKVISQGME